MRTATTTALEAAKTATRNALLGRLEPDADRDAALNLIACSSLGRDLETKNCGGDFSEHAVWALKEALEAAYEAGRAAASR